MGSIAPDPRFLGLTLVALGSTAPDGGAMQAMTGTGFDG